jgi:hypothetical protein
MCDRLGIEFPISAQATEAGGHTGSISTMVLVPEIVEGVAPTPVHAAGGIGFGVQVAAAPALGAEGVGYRSVWLTTPDPKPIRWSARGCSQLRRRRRRQVRASWQPTSRGRVWGR